MECYLVVNREINPVIYTTIKITLPNKIHVLCVSLSTCMKYPGQVTVHTDADRAHSFQGLVGMACGQGEPNGYRVLFGSDRIFWN